MLGQLVVGFDALAVVMGAVLIGDKYKDSDDAGVKFLASGGTYGVLAGVWALCSFAIWRDGFAKANGGIENYDIARRLTPEEAPRRGGKSMDLPVSPSLALRRGGRNQKEATTTTWKTTFETRPMRIKRTLSHPFCNFIRTCTQRSFFLTVRMTVVRVSKSFAFAFG